MTARQLVFTPFQLDLDNEQLWREEAVVPIRPKLFAILRYLAEHPRRLVTREELKSAAWPTTVVSESVLRGAIRELRDLLDDEATNAKFIETVPYRGYRFLPTLTISPVQNSTFRVSSSPPLPPSDRGKESSLFSQPCPWPLASETRLVGRNTELQQLHHWWTKAVDGERQMVFVTGEPGIGKTMLVDAFLSGLTGQGTGNSTPIPTDPRSLIPVPWIVRGQCIEYYGASEAYLPVLEALGRLCRQPGGAHAITSLGRYAPTWLVQMPALVDDAQLETLQRKVQGATRERMLREVAEALEVLTAKRPLALVLEDVHWSDTSTLDLLSSLAQRRGQARLLLLATYRPADVIVNQHPLRTLKQELQGRGQCKELPLRFLTLAEVEQYLAVRFPQHQFPPALSRTLQQRTEGNPLFMVNVVDEWVRQGVLSESNEQWQLTTEVKDLAAGTPESLRQMIEQQFSRLTIEERRVLETASVIGSEFSAIAVAANLDEQEENVEEWCENLTKREQFLQARGIETQADGAITGRYGFLHALYPQVLYEQLAPVRRVHLHRRIGQWEEKRAGTRVSEIAAELAMHFERGQDYERAELYLVQATDNARRRRAYQEEITLLTRALAILKHLPENLERVQLELAGYVSHLLMEEKMAIVEPEGGADDGRGSGTVSALSE